MAALMAPTSLDNDAFLTHTEAAPRLPGEKPQVTMVPSGVVDVNEDPLMTHTKAAAGASRRRDWNKTLFNLFGPGDPDRKERELRTLSVLPWMLFVWTLLLWLLMRHYSVTAVVMITLACTSVAGIGMLAWYRGAIKYSSPPTGPFATLCLIALCSGAGCGMLGWRYVWRQYWWYQTGATFEGTSASTPAMSRVDASVVSFLSGTSAARVAGTAVDNFRSAGYRAGDVYCVAPVLDPVSVVSGLARVNYWAIGINCCDDVGGFTCDDSRNHLAGQGVVMLDGGYPCPDCNSDKFAAAIKKAEALHGLVSANGALRVRWVTDPGNVHWGLSVKALLYVLGCSLTALPLLACLGGLSWYKGFGKPQMIRQEGAFAAFPPQRSQQEAQQMRTFVGWS